jgi:hypothetical protein
VSIYPWFERLHALEQHSGFELPSAHERILAFWDAVATRESVRAIADPTDFYLDRYRAQRRRCPPRPRTGARRRPPRAEARSD